MRTSLLWLLIPSALALGCGGSSSGGGSGGSGAVSGSGGQGAQGGGGTGGGGTGGGFTGGVEKIDLLLMVDNSISMADKQSLLAASVPRLILNLITPRCMSGGTPTGQNFPCDAGSTPEFAPVADLHVGVVTSSLGAHGGESCSETSPNFKPEQNDGGRLVGSTRPGLPSQDGLGFLAWAPGAIQDPTELVNALRQHVNAAGETGCGYEAQLESWYRFLIDPQPPDTVKREGNFTVVQTCTAAGADCGKNGTCVDGFCADKTVLAQRAAFLRGDSAVAIVMLTDENDCSIRDDGQGWLTSIATPGLPRATSACNANPDDPCCTSCGAPAPAGCASHNQDAECQKNGGTYTSPEDHVNLRCWEQKRRYGVDWLYPVSRYVSGLQKPVIEDRAGNNTPNPLFSTGAGFARDPSVIVLAGIVGVPWQLISTPDSQAPGANLTLLTPEELTAQGVWSKISKNGHQPASDPHMVESNAPRAGLPTASTPHADPISGHDWDIAGAFGAQGPGELQYACIFPLATPRDCASATGGCDCHATAVNGKNALCWNGTQFTSTQTHAKAYPGLRQLEVLRETGGVVGSICAKSVAGDANATAYGYNAAVDALVTRLAPVLKK